MFRKSTILALAAAASLGAFALSSSSASAFGGHVGGGHFSGSGMHAIGHGLGPMQAAHKPIFNKPIFKPIFNSHWHWHWRHYGWRRPIWIAPVVAGGVATYAAAPSAPTYNRCTCLTKEYTPQGSVVFKDICTNEMAMNPPATGPQTGDIAPQQPATVGYAEQQPQQQGYLQPQVR
jgi:hypothetical protein